jgi:hypothetical protein
MRKMSTNLSGLIMALACMTATLRAQEVKTVRMGEAAVREHSVELRAAVPTDSSITYNMNGENDYKHVTIQDGNSYQEVRYRWGNNRWTEDESVPTIRFWSYDGAPEMKEEEGLLRFTFPRVDGYVYWSWSLGVVYETKFDSKGNLTELNIGQKFIMQYDALDRIIAINHYDWDGVHIDAFKYAYYGDSPLNRTLFEHEEYDTAKKKWIAGYLGKTVRQYKTHNYDNGSWGFSMLLHEEWVADANGNWAGKEKYESEYDTDGKKTIMYHYAWYGNQWEKVLYTLYTFYSSPDANEPATASAPTAYAHGGTLHIKAPAPKRSPSTPSAAQSSTKAPYRPARRPSPPACRKASASWPLATGRGGKFGSVNN